MAGEIDLELNGLFADDETVVLTRTRLNQFLSGLTARLAANAVTAREISDGSIASGKLADGLVTADKLAAAAVTTEKMAEQVVTTTKIYDENVTAAKLAAGAVSTAKIVDAAVTTAKINDAAVTLAKLNSTATPQVFEVYTTGGQTISGSAVDVTDLSVTLTPRSANSKFLLMAKLYGLCAAATDIELITTLHYEGGASLAESRIGFWNASKIETACLFHLHSPGVDTEITYTVKAARTIGDVMLQSGKSSLLVQEII